MRLITRSDGHVLDHVYLFGDGPVSTTTHLEVRIQKQVSHGFNQYLILLTSTRHDLQRFSDRWHDPENMLQNIFTMKVHIIYVTVIIMQCRLIIIHSHYLQGLANPVSDLTLKEMPPLDQPSEAVVPSGGTSRRMCVYCLSEVAMCAFIPCGHRVACIVCEEEVRRRHVPECPECRHDVEGFCRIY